MTPSPEITTAIMFIALLVGVMLGYPLAFVLAGIGLMVGVSLWGTAIPQVLYIKLFQVATSYSFLAVPLFIFMGLMIEGCGLAERLFSALYKFSGGLRGGLAIVTVLIGTILAACVGVIGASVTMLGLVALPSMLKRGYSKDLACGGVCAGGTLGILIPPSVMLIIYGPSAQISVGKLFMAAFIPGFVLSGLYMTYIGLRCFFQPKAGPALPAEERLGISRRGLLSLVTSVLPIAVLILAVLGSIFLGIASPTEAAGVGAFCSVLLAIGYRSFTMKRLKEAVERTMWTTSMVFFVAIGAFIFTGVFLGMGCGHVVEDIVFAVPFGRWGSFVAIMFVVFILGMFIDWVGIVFIMVPLVTPIGAALGFDPLWFAMMIIINLQLSFMSPPFAYSIFFLRGVCQPEWGVTSMDIIRGVIPFLGLIMVGLLLCVIFPQIILWLPSQMMATR